MQSDSIRDKVFNCFFFVLFLCRFLIRLLCMFYCFVCVSVSVCVYGLETVVSVLF